MPTAAESDFEMIRVRLPQEMRDGWKATLEGRKISQQKAIVALIGWVNQQDPLVQTMLFGQVPETDHAELSRIVLKRLGAAGGDKGKGKK